MWRFWWDLKPGDVKGGLIGLIFLAIFLVAGFYAATPGEKHGQEARPGLGMLQREARDLHKAAGG